MIFRADPEVEMKGSCGLITRQEAAAALGAAVPAGTEKFADVPLKGGGSTKAQYCFYGSEVVLARFVDVGQHRGGGAPELKKEKALGALAVGRM